MPDTISIALSGGSTPRPIYRRLAELDLPARERLRIFFADERVVPPDDPDSNYRLARETLIEPAGIPPELVHPMIRGEAARTAREWSDAEVERAALDYEQDLPDRLDLVVLGLGADGHTASLFPDAEPFHVPGRRVLPATAPVEPHRRLTLAPSTIVEARMVVMLVSGANKAPAVRAALERGAAREVPGRLARDGIWVIDADAAAETDLSPDSPA